MTATTQPYAGEAIPGLLNEIVTTNVMRSDFLPDPVDLARLRAVSCAMRDAVDATGREVKELDASKAAEIGCLSALERLHLKGDLTTTNQPSAGGLYGVAAISGQLEVLKWLRAKSYKCGARWGVLCGSAAKFGQLEVLKWLQANGCPCDKETFAFAAEGGHLEVLTWLRENKCPWDERTCEFAAQVGHLEVLRWLRANGCPWDYCTIRSAYKHHEVQDWARRNGCPEEIVPLTDDEEYDTFDDSFDTQFDTDDGNFSEDQDELGEFELDDFE